MKKNIFITIAISFMVVFFLPGCEEHRYYQSNNRHSDRYYHRHHRPVPAGLEIQIHN